MAKSADPVQTTPIGAVCFGSTLFASILNSSEILGNYMYFVREHSGSVVECLTRDRRAAGSSLTGVTALCP